MSRVRSSVDSRPAIAARRPLSLAAAAVALLLGACAAPSAPPPAEGSALKAAGIPDTFAAGAATAPERSAPEWRALVVAPWLRGLVDAALANNRDLQAALANVQRAQAQLSLADASWWPTIGVGGGASRAPNAQGRQANTFTAGVQVNAWEVDLFGRLASLSDAALAQLLGSEAGRRSAELAVVAAVLQAGLAVQADAELVALTRATLDSREATLKLTGLRESVGAASQLELQAQLALVAQARAALAQFTRQQAQDRNLLGLLTGQRAPEMPAGGRLADEAWFAEVPVGLSSAVLLRRPDVVAAEQSLRAAQANIAAARAAFFPTLTLTAQGGQASSQLSGLFEGGHFVYTLAANAVLAVFDGGRRQAGVDSAVAVQRAAQAQYEQAIQAAFRETADALAAGATWREQAAALREQRDAARETLRLTDLRAARGAASALEQLDAQRSLLAAEQAVVQARLAELASRVALFKALGG